MTSRGEQRRAKGTTLIDLVKFLRHVRKQRPLALSARAEALLDAQIFPNAWYPHPALLDILEFTYRELLGGSEQKAYEMGMVGGRVQLQGPHKAFLDLASVRGSVLGVRHTWRTTFDFGELRAAPEGDNAVIFQLSGYEDVPPAHAYMIAGWGAAGAQLAGAAHATTRVLRMPEKAAPELVYRVQW